MKRLYYCIFAVFLLIFFSGCASQKSVTRTTKTASSKAVSSGSEKVSQKQDPARIYGDERLNQAYDDWAQAGYPVHPDSSKYDLSGNASWYGPGLNGNQTANGDTFDMYGMSAAHKKMPFGTIVVVTNENNGKSVVVRINDRGPFVAGRVIDMSYGAAYMLDMVRAGVVPVKIEIIKIGSGKYGERW